MLLIEDDEALGGQIAERLRRAGFEPVWWKEGRPVEQADTAGVALVILDLMLPGTYGMDILKGLRAWSDVPVLVLSARVDASDKIRALKLGADDYVTKPFWPEELLERVRARLRRPALQRSADAIELGGLTIDLAAREAKVDGAPIELTRVELDLLVHLARRPGAAVTRASLVDNVLDPERKGGERTLDAHVSRLRKKLGSAAQIETVWGIGYRLVGPER